MGTRSRWVFLGALQCHKPIMRYSSSIMPALTTTANETKRLHRNGRRCAAPCGDARAGANAFGPGGQTTHRDAAWNRNAGALAHAAKFRLPDGDWQRRDRLGSRPRRASALDRERPPID